MTESQVVAIVDHDQLREIALPSTSQQAVTIPTSSGGCKLQGWKVKLPKLQKNHLTGMMIICLAISCFITVFSLLMIIVPFITDLSKYQQMAKERLGWSDRNSYETLVSSNENVRSKRSTEEMINSTEVQSIRDDLERYRRDDTCFNKVKDLSNQLSKFLDSPFYYSVKIRETYKRLREAYNKCISANGRDSMLVGLSSLARLAETGFRPLRLSDNERRSIDSKKFLVDQTDPIVQEQNSVRFGLEKTNNIPPTGPEGISPGEAIKTSQQLTVSLPQVMQQTCILKSSQQQFPPAPPTYICYPNDGFQKQTLARQEQSIHVPTAIASPNPYYFPTMAGSPVINSVFESKPSFNPSTGTIQLVNPASQGPIVQFQQAPVMRPIFHHQAPQYSTIQIRPNQINSHPAVLHAQNDPYNPPQQPVYQTISLQPGSQIHVQCSYQPVPGSPYKTFSFPPVLGVSENARNSGFKSSAANYSFSQNYAVRGNCEDGFSCGDDVQTCVPASSFCDSKVDCPNGQDEINCSCNQRIEPYKRCDAFADCPDSEDETNCHGCGPGWFSCNDMDNSKPTCLPLEAKCDGVHQCPNGNDEIDCVLLFEDLHNDRKVYVSYNQGYLHRNWRGIWYPACVESDSIDLPRQACQAEQGYSHYRMPLVAFPKLKKRYDGPFIRIGGSGMTLIRSCYGDKAVYVRCPTIHCGRQHHHGTPLLRNIRKPNSNRKMMPNLFRIKTLEVSINTTRYSRGQDGRVVGGWKSEPGRWPWVVAIYRDGLFHCGGAIIDTRHILTAAHCFSMYNNHYYEVHAGILRRLSFSPQRQILSVESIFIHENYNAKTMQNDLSIIKLDRDLKLNRWVGVVCIPPFDATFPRAGDIATAVGWGATHEHGPDPDSMHEVEVPIMSACKRQVDRDAEEICAGAIEGGRDTCQGDSGGPLLCRPFTTLSPEWYVCGIVSHGEGCARPDEPGVYTRVSIFSNWIAKVVHGTKEGVQPLKYCPGRECSDGRCIDEDRICDGTIDCLRGEDEIDCPNSNESSQDYNAEIFNEIVPILRESDITSDNVGNNISLPSAISSSIHKNEGNHQLPTVNINPDYLSTFQEQSNKSSLKSELEQTSSLNTATESGTFDSIDTAIKSGPLANQNSTANAMPAYILQEEVNNTFICSKYNQQVKREYRCDGVIDCEDSSDEMGCTCKDRLHHLNPDLICNSQIDCKDRTDEKNCTSRCPEGYIFLPHSKICVPEIIRCNYKAELPDQEDEEGCYSLVPNITNVQYDENGLIVPSTRGLMVHSNSVNPRPVCLPLKNFNELNMKAIQFLGFGAWEWFLPVQLPEVGIDTCLGLYGIAKNYAKFGMKAPWLASISVEGKPSGSGVLIHPLWVLTSLRFSSQNALLLNKSFISCTLGFLNLSAGPVPVGAFEVSSKVDKVVVLPKHGLTLLRLENPVRSSSVVKPLMILDDLKQGVRDECFAVGLEYGSRVHVLNASKVDCSGNRTCYSITPIKDDSNSQDDILNVQTSQRQKLFQKAEGKWSGGIWCKDENDKPYLDCIFDSRDMCSGPCSLKCTPVLSNYPLLVNITDMYMPDEYILSELESAMEKNLDRIKRMNEMAFNYPANRAFNDYFDNDYDYIGSWNLGTNYYPSNQGDVYSDINKSFESDLPEYEVIGKRSAKSMESENTEEINSKEMNLDDNLIDDSDKQDLQSSDPNSSDKHFKASSYLVDNSYVTQDHARRGRANTVSKFKFAENNLLKKDEKSDDLVIEIDLEQGAACNGVRCSKGDCIPWSKVNDGFPDCSDGLDEDASINRTGHCLTHPNDCFGCGRNELSCGDNTCIPTHKFCDGIHDCSTMLDEPESCSTNCSSFLMLKHPSLLCDGIPHCVDGSDESWQTCGPETACNQTNSFKCKNSSGCIPMYQICDGNKNCPLGDDEEFCSAIKSNPKRLWEGLLVVRLLGEWMPRCLSSHFPAEELEEVCKLLGWKGGLKLADYSTRSAEIPTFETYSTFNLNSKTKYSIVYDRSSIALKTIDDCLSLYITCQ